MAPAPVLEAMNNAKNNDSKQDAASYNGSSQESNNKVSAPEYEPVTLADKCEDIVDRNMSKETDALLYTDTRNTDDNDCGHVTGDSGHVTQDSDLVTRSSDRVTSSTDHIAHDTPTYDKSETMDKPMAVSQELDKQQDAEEDGSTEVNNTEPNCEDNIIYDEPAPPVPPDGGYGWVIVFCGFMVNLLVDGMCYMGGMLYIELLDYFQQPKGKTQWVHTLVPAVYLMSGPFVGALVNKYGCRLITIVGSLISATFFVISSFVPNVESMIFTYGIMIGIGFGLMYLPAVCFVSYYFDRRRAIATGISVCGSGIGTFVFPPFQNYLISTYGWRGSLYILAGLSLNCCVFGALMRPLESARPKPKSLPGEPNLKKTKKNKKDKKEKIPTRRSIIMQKIVDQKERQRTISNGSLDGTVITNTNQLVKDPDLLKTILIAETQHTLDKNTFLNVSAPDLRPNANAKLDNNLNISDSSKSLQSSCTDLDAESEHSISPQIINKHLQNVTGLQKRHRGTSQSGSQTFSSCLINSTQALERKRKDVARVMYRKDIFYAGSVTSIAEYKSNPNIDQYTQSVLSVPESGAGGATGSCAPFTNVINQMFDLKLFRSVTFIVLISNAFFSFLGFFVPFMFIPDLANIMGSSASKAALLISVLGICNTFGRLAAGWLADRPWADCLVIQNVALITGGIATALVPLLKSYVLLAAYCCVFGTCMAMFIALRSIVTAEMMGVQKLNNAFGLTIFFQGVAGAAGAPLAGTIFDATGSYTVSFVIAGSFIAFSGLICLPLRRIAQWENAKSQDGDGYQVVALDDLPLPEIEVGGSGKEVQFVVDQNGKNSIANGENGQQ